MQVFPGMTSTTRTLTVERDLAKSFDRLVIRLAFIPAAGSSSNRVITGPGSTATTSTSIPKSFNFNSTCRDIASSDAAENPLPVGAATSSKLSSGKSLCEGRSNRTVCFSFSARKLG